MKKQLKVESEKVIDELNIRILYDAGKGLYEKPGVKATPKTLHYCDDKSIWEKISKKKDISEEFLYYYRNKLNWQVITRTRKLSREFIYKHFDLLHTTYAYQYQDIDEKLLLKIRKKHKSHFNSKSYHLDKLYSSRMVNILSSIYSTCYFAEYDWPKISKYNKYLSLQFLKDYRQYINWYDFCEYNNVTIEVIEAFPNKIMWEEVSKNKYVKPNVLIKYKNKINWKLVTQYSFFITLPNYLKQVEDLIYWPWLLKNEKIDLKIRKKYAHKVKPELAIEYKLITEKKYKNSLTKLTKFDILDIPKNNKR